ncbi:MAG: hypothetical protein NVS1B7_0420 [Candidatus Saccharimonadales bacterium]
MAIAIRTRSFIVSAMDSVLQEQLLQAVTRYKMPEAAKQLVASSKLLAICGVTAAGKNTIVNYLIEHDDFAYMVSHTTRKPRINHGTMEQNGRDYWFVSESKMLELVETESFVEVKQVHGSTFYGTSILTINQAVQSDKRPITELDVQGAQELMVHLPELRPMFVLPPSYEVWMTRLNNRGTLDSEDQLRRLHSARAELQIAIDNPSFAFIVNHDFHDTVAEIMRGIDVSRDVQADRRRLARQLLTQID